MSYFSPRVSPEHIRQESIYQFNFNSVRYVLDLEAEVTRLASFNKLSKEPWISHNRRARQKIHRARRHDSERDFSSTHVPVI